MKRLICALVLVCLSLCGCVHMFSEFKEPVTFYYPRAEYQYGEEESVIANEQREASGHTSHINYLLAMYLAGPLDEGLASSFPAGTHLVNVEKKDNALTVKLNSALDSMSDHAFSLGCTCLTLTCLELTDVAEVTVVSGERSITISREDLTLYDDVLVEPKE